MPVSQVYQGIADIAFSGLKGERPAPKAGALPTALHPVIKLNYPAGRILPKPGAIPTSLYPDIHFSAMIPRRGGKSKIFLSVVIYVVKADFIPLSAIVESPTNAGVARLCGVSPCPVPDTATALPKQARYQLRSPPKYLFLFALQSAAPCFARPACGSRKKSSRYSPARFFRPLSVRDDNFNSIIDFLPEVNG